MAVDVCSDISSLVLVSPRISFSHDLNQSDVVPVECRHSRSDALLLDSTADFDFCIAHEISLSSADELFADGKILPTEIKKVTDTKEIHQSDEIAACDNLLKDAKKKRLKEFLFDREEEGEEEKPSSKSSFWQFRRSSSLNCDNNRSKGLIRSLQILSRSNSTGSALNQKQPVQPKVLQKQHSQKQPSFASSVPSSTPYYFYNSSKRPPLKKNCGAYGNGVRISPVLNIPPAYISKGTASLFGIGSLFCNGKAKKKKK